MTELVEINILFTVTGQPLRCDVIVDEIVRVEIETTTKELFLDDSPEEFVLRGVNDKGIFLRSSCVCFLSQATGLLIYHFSADRFIV